MNVFGGITGGLLKKVALELGHQGQMRCRQEKGKAYQAEGTAVAKARRHIPGAVATLGNQGELSSLVRQP